MKAPRKYYTSKELPQRSQEWFVERMGRFTSSDCWQLFTEPTQEKRINECIGSIKKGQYSMIPFLEIKKDKNTSTLLTKFATALEMSEEEKKLAKKQIFEKQSLDRAAQILHKINAVYHEKHCFSKGAEDFIWCKAWDFIFPRPEVRNQTPAMQRGEELEPYAKRAYFRKFKNLQPEDVLFVTLGNDIASSPDQLAFEKIQNQKCCAEFNVGKEKLFLYRSSI